MSSITERVDVRVPVRTAYDQWTRFEDFPRFMEGVESVQQIDDTHLRWKTRVAGHQLEFAAVVTEQTPDQRVAWTSEQGAEHAGVVTFHRLGDHETRVTVQIDVQPDGPLEKMGDALGLVARRIRGDLEHFKELIESRAADGGSAAGRGTPRQTAAR